jgi:two-component system, sensor histidine kinase YesM
MHYKIRLILISIILVIVGQGAYLTNSILSLISSTNKIERQSDIANFENLYDNVSKYFSNAEMLSEHIAFQELIDFVTFPHNIYAFKESDILISKLNETVDSLNISAKDVEKFYFIGLDENYRGYYRNIADPSDYDADVPNFKDLYKTGILEEFAGDPFFYFKKGSFVEKLESRKDKIDENAYRSVSKLARSLEGKIVYYSFTKGRFLMIMVLNSSFMEELCRGLENQDKYVTILDTFNNSMWANSDIKPFTDFYNTELVESEPLNKTSLFNNIEGTSKSAAVKILDRYGLKMVYIVPSSSSYVKISKFILRYAVISIFSVILAFIISLYVSKVIIEPIKTLTYMVDKIIATGRFDHIPNVKFVEYPLSRLSLRSRVVMFFFLSVIMPLLFSGVFYVQYIHGKTTDKLEEKVITASRQMAANLSNQARDYENLIGMLGRADVFQKVLTTRLDISNEVRQKMELSILKKPPSIADVSYFVLYTSSGTVKYQTIYSNNSYSISNGNEFYKFPLISVSNYDKKFSKQNKDILWMTDTPDLFNNTVNSLAMKIVENSDNGLKTLGYLQMFLKDSVFQPIMKIHQLDFLVTDKDGNTIYNSRRSKTIPDIKSRFSECMKNKGGAILHMKIDNKSHIVVWKEIPELEWDMYVFQRTDDLFSESISLLKRNICIVVFICVIAFILTLWFTKIFLKPISALQESVKKGTNNEIFERVKYKASKDEIGTLINSFNYMVDNIRNLMEDNINIKTRENELITLKTQAELNVLQQQINPHFLYNTLEAINVQVKLAGEERASMMLTALAQMFRFTTKNSSSLILLEKELEHVKNYVMIQQMRFNFKFTMEWSIDDDTSKLQVLKFILQPIVENSINHGLYSIQSEGLIQISTKLINGRLKLSISDNGVGIRAPELARINAIFCNSKSGIDEDRQQIGSKGNGIALQNVYRRLYLHYKGNISMEITSKYMHGTTVSIDIPIIE